LTEKNSLMPELPDDAAPQSFEGSLAQLQQIVHDLEEGQLGLEVSLSRFEEGIRLLRSCYRILEQAEHRIEILTGQDSDGNPITAPFDSTATFEAGEEPAKTPERRRGPGKPEPTIESAAADRESELPERGGLF
jgi:exodeoxyribonuclease VII small subunit